MIVMLIGVVGTGKTTIGSKLASDMGWRFYDADDVHGTDVPPTSRPAQDGSGDAGAAWVLELRRTIELALAKRENLVVACSALRDIERQRLHVDPTAVRFVYLKATPDLVRARLRLRSGYFANETLIARQFAALEEPASTGAVTVEVDARPGRIVEQIRDALGI